MGFSDEYDALAVERHVHRMLVLLRVKGEWYLISDLLALKAIRMAAKQLGVAPW
jgi:hypothetical protein